MSDRWLMRLRRERRGPFGLAAEEGGSADAGLSSRAADDGENCEWRGVVIIVGSEWEKI